MSDSLFYNLGKKAGPKFRKARWMWESLTGTEAEAIGTEHAVGLDAAQEVRQQLQMDREPRVRETLDALGLRLTACVANKLRSFHFDAFLGGEPNAFALPGGFIFVGRPIIELCRWDHDEIAFILAHEMSHVIRGHAIERIVTNSALSAASRAGPVRGVVGAWLRNVGVQFLETAYSRDQEVEADKLGTRLTAAAGCDPRAALRLLTRLGELRDAPDPFHLGEYFATHPKPESRIRIIRHYLARNMESERNKKS
jgi:predicted Zn-dependent protease